MAGVAVPAGAGLSPRWRLPLLLLGFLCLAAGLVGGLSRAGFGATLVIENSVALHGVLMVSGFFGTVISLERAVALDRGWAYAAPLASGLGGMALLVGAALPGSWLLVAGAAVLLTSSVVFIVRRSSLEAWTLAGGAACWLAGNALFALGAPLAALLGWWIAFFALTIGAERLELSRYMPRSRAAHGLFAAIALALMAGAIGSLRFAGAALVALAAWLLVYDLARKTVQGTGLARYVAVCLLAGYAWLAIGGALLAFGIGYDAPVHALMVGFVFSMVFGHAPVIVPAVLRRALPYTPWLYLPLALLHVSLAVRVAGGLAGEHAVRATGSAGNALAIAIFIATAATQAVRHRVYGETRLERIA